MTETAPAEKRSTSTGRILVADSNAVSVERLRKHLEAKGHLVDWAADGAHALAMATSGGYDVMLLDVHVPIYDGVEVMRRLHLLIGRRLYVIAITAARPAGRREEMARMGADAYLTKPIDLQVLDKELHRGLVRSRT
ncbi:MAG TPA: response regulator [Candidatus Dormibacteraeota bacterium]|nr:response regulator [Candidatus Dormibacteraeota bacterium]